jgi:hypothetical protein
VKVTDWGKKLSEWSAAHNGADVLATLRTRMNDVCGRQGAQAQTCRQWIA